MTTHHFTINILAKDIFETETLNKLYDAGCDDATFGFCDGSYYAMFSREAHSYDEAVESAIKNIKSVLGANVKIVSVEKDDSSFW